MPLSMRYRADITAGSLKVVESRVVADLLLRGVDAQGWKDAVVTQNLLQARNPATARRLGRLIRKRLELMDADLWRLVRDGTSDTATHAVPLQVSQVQVKHVPTMPAPQLQVHGNTQSCGKFLDGDMMDRADENVLLRPTIVENLVAHQKGRDLRKR
jgi:hypothetical protein